MHHGIGTVPAIAEHPWSAIELVTTQRLFRLFTDVSFLFVGTGVSVFT